ncbi:MAG: hypothetical protein NVS9B14_14110 [Candidatus Acidiferrum sp.]
MLCPKCSREIPPAFTSCPVCAQNALVGDPLSVSASAQQSASPPVRVRLLNIYTLLVLAVVFAVAYLKAKVWSHGIFTPQATGYLVGAAATPLLISWFFVWLLNRKKTPPMPGYRRGAITVSAALGLSLLSLFGELSRRGEDNQSLRRDVGHLLKQASWKENPGADVNWYDGPTRTFFRDVIRFGQEYTAAIRAADKSSLSTLYTPESYASQAGIKKTISQLRILLDIDKKYESLDPIVQALEKRVQGADASQSDKDAFLKGVRESAGKSMAPRQETFHADEAWLESAVGLYEFMLAHFTDYSVRRGKIEFKSDALLKEFQQRQSKSSALRNVVTDARNKLDAARQNVLSKMDVSPDDIPVNNGSQK